MLPTTSSQQLQLKIQKVNKSVNKRDKLDQQCYSFAYKKAVICPTDLGLESNCTRLIDDVSCHCASFTKVKKKYDNIEI
jgi:hypothetical protein